MLRWLVLVGSFIVWVGCMSVVYFQCKPTPIEGAEAAARMALDRMFAENALDTRFWNIYVDPDELESAGKMFIGSGNALPKLQPKAERIKGEWSGLNENALIKVGRLETRVKNRRDVSLDEESTLKLKLPGAGIFADYTGTSHLTVDNGLENCSMALKIGVTGFEIDALGNGVRDGEDLHMTTSFLQNGQTLYSGNRTEKIGGNTALNAELVPFQFNPDVLTGFEWTIVMLDLNMGMGNESQGPRPIRVKCTGNTTIMMNGSGVRVYKVRSDDGTARAWYSPNGTVLKQAFRLAGVLEVVIVRDDKPELKK